MKINLIFERKTRLVGFNRDYHVRELLENFANRDFQIVMIDWYLACISRSFAIVHERDSKIRIWEPPNAWGCRYRGLQNRYPRYLLGIFCRVLSQPGCLIEKKIFPPLILGGLQ